MLCVDTRNYLYLSSIHILYHMYGNAYMDVCDNIAPSGISVSGVCMYC